jgi:hypothetical protein
MLHFASTMLEKLSWPLRAAGAAIDAIGYGARRSSERPGAWSVEKREQDAPASPAESPSEWPGWIAYDPRGMREHIGMSYDRAPLDDDEH